jgi:hypothetical protein
MSLSKIDQAIAVINFSLKQRRKRVEEVASKVQLSANDRIKIGEEEKLFQNIEILVTQCKNYANAWQGKLAPQATELETAVLGAMILEVPAQATISILEPIHFYKQENAEIFEAMQTMQKRNESIDMLSLVVHLRKTDMIEKVGGAHYIAELTAKVSSTANVNYHAHVLIEMSIKRELIKMCGTVMQDSYGDGDFSELIDYTENQLKTIKSWIR